MKRDSRASITCCGGGAFGAFGSAFFGFLGFAIVAFAVSGSSSGFAIVAFGQSGGGSGAATITGPAGITGRQAPIGGLLLGGVVGARTNAVEGAALEGAAGEGVALEGAAGEGLGARAFDVGARPTPSMKAVAISSISSSLLGPAGPAMWLGPAGPAGPARGPPQLH